MYLYTLPQIKVYNRKDTTSLHRKSFDVLLVTFLTKVVTTLRLLKADNVRTFTIAYRKSFDVLLVTFLTKVVTTLK